MTKISKSKSQSSPRYGVMLCGHGSRAKSAVNEFAALAGKLKNRFPEWPLEYGYLEFAEPVIADGLDKLRAQGVNHILAIPGMLFAAGHAKNDIPATLNTYAAKHGITIEYGRELGVDTRMLAAAAARITDAIADADARGRKIAAHDTCLVMIGRGSSDPDANSNVAKIARMLGESLGLGWCETGFSGVTFPLVEPCLEKVTRLGFVRVVVAPYFLFSGILIDRIYGFTDAVAARHKDIDFVKARYLGDHEKVVETFTARVHEILTGDNKMNCALCKYREQVLGFEDEVGAAQTSHHHHVEGKGFDAPGSNVAACEFCDDFCTGACRLADDHAHDHTHDHTHAHGHHHHHPYPHADHPLGPRSVLSRKKNKKDDA